MLSVTGEPGDEICLSYWSVAKPTIERSTVHAFGGKYQTELVLGKSGSIVGDAPLPFDTQARDTLARRYGWTNVADGWTPTAPSIDNDAEMPPAEEAAPLDVPPASATPRRTEVLGLINGLHTLTERSGADLTPYVKK